MHATGPGEDPLAHLSNEERALVMAFLALVRDNYKAAYFLERQAGVVNTCSMTNLRDVLSHLATLLDPNTPPRKRASQLASAEEHLRRAILEPYEIGLANLTEKFEATYEIYRRKILARSLSPGFAAAPNRVHVEGRLAEINLLALQGKQAKGRNMWDGEWEDGVAAFAESFNKLAALHSEIEDWVFKKRHIGLGRWGIAWTIVGLLLGAAITYAVTKYVSGPDKAASPAPHPLTIPSPPPPK
jgi:hypothetical protein